MSSKSFIEQRSLLQDPVRLGILVAIASESEPVEFMTLASTLNLTRGNLSSHARKLEEAGYLLVHKEFLDRKPRTTFSCTTLGKTELQTYLQSMEAFLKSVKTVR